MGYLGLGQWVNVAVEVYLEIGSKGRSSCDRSSLVGNSAVISSSVRLLPIALAALAVAFFLAID
jgi:hypothetical protein